MNPTPTPAPLDLYAPRLIRVASGIQRCVRCQRPIFKTITQSGWGFHTCEHKRCDQEWWALALPPECFGGWLAAVAGERDATHLISRCWPEFARDRAPQLWYTQLSTEEPTWIQIAVRARERHLYRQANMRDFLPKLLREAA